MIGFFEDTITLVNHYIDSETREDKFIPHVLDKCMWRASTVRNVSTNALTIATTINVSILSRDSYVDPSQFPKLDDEQKKNHFTLNLDKTDFIFYGEVKEDLSTIKAINEAKKTHKWATIQSVVDCTNVDELKHWEVVGQ